MPWVFLQTAGEEQAVIYESDFEGENRIPLPHMFSVL